MKEQIQDWLNDNNFDAPREVKDSDEFIDFLKQLFANVETAQIEEKVNQLSLVYDNIKDFSNGLNKSLSN